MMLCNGVALSDRENTGSWITHTRVMSLFFFKMATFLMVGHTVCIHAEAWERLRLCRHWGWHSFLYFCISQYLLVSNVAGRCCIQPRQQHWHHQSHNKAWKSTRPTQDRGPQLMRTQFSSFGFVTHTRTCTHTPYTTASPHRLTSNQSPWIYYI